MTSGEGTSARRFPSRWTIEEHEAPFVIPGQGRAALEYYSSLPGLQVSARGIARKAHRQMPVLRITSASGRNRHERTCLWLATAANDPRG